MMREHVTDGTKVFINPTVEIGNYAHSQFNIEYRLDVEHRDKHKVERRGQLGTTTEEYPYQIKGGVLIRAIHSPHDHLFRQDNYWVNVTYQVEEGEAQAESSERTFALEKDELEEICNEHFPLMGMTGSVTLTVSQPFPGDTTKSTITEMVQGAIQRNYDFAKVTRAHKAFLEAFGYKEQEEQKHEG